MPTGGSSVQPIESFVGQDLAGFRLLRMSEVFRIDSDGRKSKTLGFFVDPNVAAALAEDQVDKGYYRVEPSLLLTNGVVGFVVLEQGSVPLPNEEEERKRLREAALAKLAPAARAILGM